MNQEKLNSRLVVLFQEMSDHTKPECQHTCRVKMSCCDAMYCAMAQEGAKEDWGIDLEPFYTGHETLPFMGPNGCVVAPHLRPLCTLHTCQVNGIGFKPGDDAWNEKYFKIREEIETLEYQRSVQKETR